MGAVLGQHTQPLELLSVQLCSETWPQLQNELRRNSTVFPKPLCCVAPRAAMVTKAGIYQRGNKKGGGDRQTDRPMLRPVGLGDGSVNMVLTRQA